MQGVIVLTSALTFRSTFWVSSPMPTNTISASKPESQLGLAAQLLRAQADRDRWKQLYEETLEALKQEQIAHAQTKENLLKILGDTIASRA